jgi:quinol monooxygenase YgiN
MANLFISRWQIDPDKREQFLTVFNELYEAAKPLLEAHTTALHYGWGRDENEFVAIEAWKDEAMVAGLRQSPEFKDVFARMMACASAPMRMELINDLSNDRAIFAAHPAGPSTVHPEVGHGTLFI